jgi:FkbM family methyltransferase
MKQMLLGSGLGRVALITRDAVQLLLVALRSPETVGTLANDQIATFLLTRLCLPNKGFVDVGAHIGSIISEVAYHDPSIKLYAVEPIPAKIDKLRRKFPSIELYGCAVGESDGEIAFFINKKQSGYSSIVRPTNCAEAFEMTVPLKKLDSLISSNNIDIIKIDVEGAELGVVRGGDRLIARCRPLVMFESGPPTNDGLGYSKESIWHWLAERDFEIVLPNRVAHNGPGLNLDGFIEAHFYPRRTTNYFAIPKERRIEARDRARSVLAKSR